ncbi:polynucleotide 5'-hydroxyl-kinase GRC3/NOL9 [Nitrosospira multiformis]|uniref:Polynucleotide 5'-hydroxyl-kinase GRC3/NOL9 n=1 Tax=Nitrosospira multiformis TaxID=1231 RepID=A0A1H8EZ56_9PROT|nr:Clp1/GlmU family protein [Nitrosospira multiformis]SEN24167.1 polynucleotide 5'-hydroxyl-kinase GRC3/NOL9 [Nitrosospira multiformis]
MVEIGLDVPAAWERSAKRILSRNWRRIMVLGATDLGKSSYCRFLINRLLREGNTVSFVDADIGQKDIGPPATVTLAELETDMDFANAACRHMYFVGHINPVAHFLPLVLGTRQLVEAAQGECVVVDTPGLLGGRGRVLVSFQIESLHPDVLVCLERDDELAPIRCAARHCNILRLQPSHLAAHKSRRKRRRAREEAFRAYFQDAREVGFWLEEITVQRSSLFNGKPVEDPRFVYAELLPEGLIAVAAEVASPAWEGVAVLPRNFADQLLCGVADEAGRCLGLAIISGIDFSRKSLTLYTPVPKARIRLVLFGDLYLDQDGHELHLGRLGHF